MAEGRRSQKPKTPAWFFLALIAIVGYSAYTLLNQQVLLNSIEADTVAAQLKLDQVKADNDVLLQENQNLQNPEYIEKIAREELGMTRDGELPYIYTKNSQ